MKQTFSLFSKDVRHLRPEIGAYAGLLMAYCIAAPQTRLGHLSMGFSGIFVTLVKLLMLVSCFVLIARAVQEDKLVGEEQFWITRPYRWTSLLAAKLLFTAVCVFLPFVLMQWVVLLGAGLNPFAEKTGMVLSLLRVVLNVLLPFLVAASVTENLAAALTFIMVLLVSWAGSLTLLLSGKDMRMSPPYELELFGALFGGLLLGTLIYQYARRRTLHSRAAILLTLALFLLMIVGYDRAGFGPPIQALIRSHYPVRDSPRLVFAGSAPYEDNEEDMVVPRDQVEIKLPIHIEGLPSGAKFLNTNILITLDAAGTHYSSPWERVAVSEDFIAFQMPKSVWDRFAGTPARLHLELVAEELRLARVESITVADRFAGPLHGSCELILGGVYCRYPYQEMTPTRVQAEVKPLRATCGDSSKAVAMAASLRHVPPGWTPDPVIDEQLPIRGTFCLGDQLQFSEFASAGNIRLILDLPSLNIAEYGVR